MKRRQLFMSLSLCAISSVALAADNRLDEQDSQIFENAMQTLYADKQLKGDLLITLVSENGLEYTFTLNPNGTSPEQMALVKTPRF